MAVYSMMFMGMSPLGALAAGAVAQRIGARWTVALGGLLAILGAIAFARYLPKIRVEARQLISAQGMGGNEPVQEIAARGVL
jgi:cyanate permease